MTYKSVRRELDSTKQGFGRWRKGSLVWSSLKNIIYLREWRKEVKGNKYCMDQSWRWAMTISGIKFHLSTCVCTRAHTHTHSVTRMLRNLCPSQCVCVRVRTHTHTELSDKDAQEPVPLPASVVPWERRSYGHPLIIQWPTFSVSAYTQLFWLPRQLAL